MNWNLLSPKQIGHTLILMNYVLHQMVYKSYWKNLNPNKSMGPDQIHPRVLKQLATVILLTVIVNKSLHSGEVPED